LVVGDVGEHAFRDAGYDLRIDTLIAKMDDGSVEKHTDDFDLPPQGIAAVTSREIIRLPPDVCAFASVKTSLCRDGVLAINIGIVDPGWDGPISSTLLNFGKYNRPLKSGDAFLRLTFHMLRPPAQPTRIARINHKVYEEDIERKVKKRLAASFMDFDRAAEKASQRFVTDLRNALLKYLPFAALLLALLTFFLNYGVLSIASRAMPFDVVQLRAQALVDGIKKQTDELKRQNDGLKLENDAMKKDNEDIRRRLDSVTAILDKLPHK
jgi:deoxycytidine triphosphate deaminase